MINKGIQKSTNQEIKARFDNDVERFSNLETGQQTFIDAKLCLELVAESVGAAHPNVKSVLDIGCGAGNYSVKLSEKFPHANYDLLDLSEPMLKRASERLAEKTDGSIKTYQRDILEFSLPKEEYCVVLAGAVLHHLREDEDWELVFRNIYESLKPGGSFWIIDLIIHETEALNQLFSNRYADFLKAIGGVDYQSHVFDYIEKEDTPRSLVFQLELMKKVGFRHVDVLHKNLVFAAFGAIK